MAGFTAPIDPAGWTLEAVVPLTVPAGLRYAGAHLPALRATRTAPAAVRVPTAGTLRRVGEVVEVEVSAFRHRDVAVNVPGRLPTFYFAFDTGTTLVPFGDGDAAEAGRPARIGDRGEHRVRRTGSRARDPALWARQIADAHGQQHPRAGPPSQPRLSRPAPSPRCCCSTTRGAPLPREAWRSAPAPITATAELVAADGGDLQRAVARMHAANPGHDAARASVFAAGAPVTLRPSPATMFRLPGLAGVRRGRGSCPRTRRGDASLSPRDVHRPEHVARTAVRRAEALARYTRGNTLTPFVNGGEYFDDLFRRVQDGGTRRLSGGLHLVGGWQTFPTTSSPTARSAAGRPSALPLTHRRRQRQLLGRRTRRHPRPVAAVHPARPRLAASRPPSSRGVQR